jgi:DNA polymerase III epsilon subunit-like protein
MAKQRYHINPRTGNPNLCRALTKCPFGEASDHYATAADAREAFENNFGIVHQALTQSVVDFNQKDERLFKVSEELDQFRRLVRDRKSTDYQKLSVLEQKYRDATDDLRKAFYHREIIRKKAADLNISNDEIVALSNSNGSDTIESKKNQQVYFMTSKAKPEFEKPLTGSLKTKTVAELSAWGGLSMSESARLLAKYENDTQIQQQFSRKEYINNLFQTHQNTTSERVFVDLETTGLHPSTSEIIEIGIIRTSPDGKILERINQRFGLQDESILEQLGTGPEHVHRISREDIRGLKPFISPEVQEQMGKIFNDRSRVVTAHNINFEDNFLNQYLEGYKDCRFSESAANLSADLDPAPKNDTKNLSAMFVRNKKKNQLKDFVEANGMVYSSDAHRAVVDAEMTWQAYESLRKKMKESLPGQTPFPALEE